MINEFCSAQYGGKYCGMAEMNGPYIPDAYPQMWINELHGHIGVIPIKWIVVKDVDFSRFDDLKYREQAVTQLRHANTYVRS